MVVLRISPVIPMNKSDAPTLTAKGKKKLSALKSTSIKNITK